jgi:hypothetical protein
LPDNAAAGARPRLSFGSNGAGVISVHEAVRDEVKRIRPVPIFDLERWHPSIATLWVLSRNKKFIQACVRGYGSDANTVQLEADERRRVSFLRARNAWADCYRLEVTGSAGRDRTNLQR